MADDRSVVVPCTFLGSIVCVLHSSYVSAIVVNTFVYSPVVFRDLGHVRMHVPI